MLLLQLEGAVVQFALAQLVRSEIGIMGLVLLTLATVGVRTRNVPLTSSAALFFVLLMLQA